MNLSFDDQALRGQVWEGEALYLPDNGRSVFGKLCLSAKTFAFRKPADKEGSPFLRGDISAAAGAIAVTDSKVTLKCSNGTFQFGLFPSAANSLREWVKNTPKEVVRIPPAPVKKEPPIYKSAPKMIERLSDLSIAFSSEKSDTTTNQYSSKFEQLGATFFGNNESIMASETSDTSQLQTLAISRFARLMESFTFCINRFSFAENATCSKTGYIKYHVSSQYVSGEGYCYDGGCYSEESSYTIDHYYHLRRITSDRYDAQKVRRMELRKYASTVWQYNAIVPYADQTEVFIVDRTLLYLKDPMGILGYYEIELECQA